LESFFGSPKTQLMVRQELRALVKRLKDMNYELSDKEFEMLHKGSSFLAATTEEAENVREHFVPGYILLVRKLEDHLASAPS